MRRFCLVLASAMAWLGGPASAAEPPEPPEAPQVLEHRCGDLIVIGRVTVLSYGDIEDENDLLGHGVFTVDVDIARVLRGSETRRRVRANFVAHAQIRHDLDFLMALSPRKGREYLLNRFVIWDRTPRPVLAGKCT